MDVKKLILTVVTAYIFGAGSTTALAAGFISANKIQAVSFQTGGFFLGADVWTNVNSCTKSNAIVLLDTDPNYDKAYSLLLAAYLAGKKVSGYSNGCVEFDGQTYNTIRGYKYLVISD